MKNAKFRTQDIKKVCEKKLNIKFKSGKEFNGWFFLDKKKAARITVPKGRKFIPRKTYKRMADQLKLKVYEFDELLECPLKLKLYERILRERVN